MKNRNMLIFMTDHQRWDMIPPYKKCHTPNYDELFKESAVFTNAYCPSPHCCPSRATFHTGLYPTEHGVWNNVNVGNTLSAGLNAGVRLWSEDLKDKGYRLFHVGKWHVSNEQGPADFGWEDILSEAKYTGRLTDRTTPSAYEWERYKNNDCSTFLKGEFPQTIRKPGEILREGYTYFKLYGETEHPFNDDNIVSKSVERIKAMESVKEPWVLYCGTLGPHDPYMVPKRFLDMYKPEDIELPDSFHDNMLDKPNLYRRTQEKFNQLSPSEYKEAIRHYLAFCSYEDYLLGRLVKALKEKGLYDDTIIICLSDHGDYNGEHRLFAKGLPCFRSAYHIPLMIRWPEITTGERGGRIIDNFVTLADMAPTILEMADVKEPRSFSGVSLVRLIKGEQVDNWQDAVFTQSNGNELYGIQRSVMTREWKYVFNGFDYDELYDLKNDPEEMYNLSKDARYRSVMRDLSKRLWTFAYEHKDVCVNPYVMVSLAEFGPGIIFE